MARHRPLYRDSTVEEYKRNFILTKAWTRGTVGPTNMPSHRNAMTHPKKDGPTKIRTEER